MNQYDVMPANTLGEANILPTEGDQALNAELLDLLGGNNQVLNVNLPPELPLPLEPETDLETDTDTDTDSSYVPTEDEASYYTDYSYS